MLVHLIAVIDPFKRMRQVERVLCFPDLTSASARKPASKSAPPYYAGVVAVRARRVRGFRSQQQLGPATHATELAASVEAVSQAARDEPPLHAREIESANNPGMFFTEHNWAKSLWRIAAALEDLSWGRATRQSPRAYGRATAYTPASRLQTGQSRGTQAAVAGPLRGRNQA